MAQDIGSDRRIASLVGGRYQITGLIASGGMGEVFQAHDKVLDRVVALKVLRAGLGSDDEFIERFRKEATIAGRLSHPNIVQVYDWGRGEDGSAYMAMEFVDGQNLREVLSANGRLRPSIASRIAAQVCAALEAARKAGLVHRDVKPENILLTADGGVKVADFGLSRTMAESRATQAGVLMGTAHYLAPEQVEGHQSDHRADIYALGVVLYEMLTGETPFTGDNPLVIAYQRVRHDVPMPSTRVGGVPPGLDEVVRCATERDAGKRFGSAAAMADALRAATPRSDTGEVRTLVHPTIAIPVGTQETIQLRRRRGPRITRRGIIVIAALLAAMLAAIPLLTGALARVDVPDVTNAAKADAQATLKRAGFKVTAESENHPDIAAGHVIRTEPKAGTSARKGSTVKLIVSSGPVTVQVPNVVGMRYEQAEKLLTGRGFEVEKIDAFSPTVPKGRVIEQDREADAIFPQGTKVTLTVSKGKERLDVPDVKNKPEAVATKTLADLGFVVTVQKKNDEKIAAGLVISQTPEAGTKVDKGSAVTLVVSLGPTSFPMPDVRGMDYDEAKVQLEAMGLIVQRQQVPGSVGDTVVGQDPTAGKKVRRGDKVKLFTA